MHLYRTPKLVKMHRISLILLGLLCVVFISSPTRADRNRVSCYESSGRPQRCVPPFVNAAFNLPVEATNTCGLRATGGTLERPWERTTAWEYCRQTGISGEHGATKTCDVCDSNDAAKAHPSSYLTDFHNVNNETWWQSETMLEDIQWPSMINLTLSLGKAFDITYVRLKFHSSRPESFAIYKRTRESTAWIPYQFYSASCRETYDRSTKEIITRLDETKAICTDEFSDISPLTGASVAFSTLEGRPSAYNFEDSPELQDFVTATDIRIVLNRMNTFGDEVFGDPNVLKSYYYAISDFAVGGRCKCNGHASQCDWSTGQGLQQMLVCLCQHNTQGQNCEECLPFYNDRPWNRATASDAHECQPCECNGLSQRCFFDEDLYRRTGHGGHCLDCRDNTAGPHCERCKDNYYRRTNAERCQPCNCNPIGSEHTQCDGTGRCRCKPGVTGEHCDRCQPNYFEFGPNGCRQCQCQVAGSHDNNPECLTDTGICQCKEFVEGQNCDRCKMGYFGLNLDDPLGCMACFCYGHSLECQSSPGYALKVLHSDFNSGRQKWGGEDREGNPGVPIQYNAITGSIGISAPTVDPVYFAAPDKYLGDQRFSYNQDLTFSLRVGEEGAGVSRTDVVVSGNGLTISTPIYAQGNNRPRTTEIEYTFRLHQHASYGWMPELTAMEFIRLLSNVSEIRIRGSYTPQGVGFLDNVKLQSAQRGGGVAQASSIEQCECPQGYVGQFCESCAPGFHRDPVNGGPFARCMPCNCNGHSDTCDVNSGRCICRHNTAGDNCERCASGYYGYALGGTAEDCVECPCPDRGACVELLNGEVACINCREGYAGNRCEVCADGYYGDPTGRYGPRRPCQKCTCNDNIDPNAVANCNTTTGECLKCIYNTAGFFCDDCLPGYYGDALGNPKGQCQACDCYAPGSQASTRPDHVITCDAQSGRCRCQIRVTGRKCDECIEGFWNINSGNGCEGCNCHPVGSYNNTCETHSGQCHCNQGVAGRTCDQCMENYYGFSRDGCNDCECDPYGSRSLQCNQISGACDCHQNIEGRMCNLCMENKYNISAGCIDCPVCYNLIQHQVNILRRRLIELHQIIVNIGDNPQTINDTDFRTKMVAVNESVNQLWKDAQNAAGGIDGSLGNQLDALKQALMDIMMECGTISETITTTTRSSHNSKIDVTAAELAIDEAERRLREAEVYIETDGRDAIERAKAAQEKAGQQSNRMTEIARQARVEAENQVEQSTIIEITSITSRNTSYEALRIVQEALQKPMDIADQIEQLRRDVNGADSLYEQTKQMAEQALDQANMAYDDSINIYLDADGLKLPDVDLDALVRDANQIKGEAAEIKKSADELIEQNRHLLIDVERQKAEANIMLEDGVRQQQIADELLAEADSARDIARKAVEKAEKTLRDAQEVLKTLMEFDEKVRLSQERAREAMKHIPDIEDQITEAEDKTYDARLNLADAERDAEAAVQIAQDAKLLAEQASKDASDIRVMAEMTKERATQLRDEAERHQTDVNAAGMQLDNLRIQADEDERLAKEALQKADQAKTSARDSSQKVEQALNEVNEILRQLQNLDSIDLAKLDELEFNLSEAERRLLEAEIERRYMSLLESRERQTRWVRDYTNELVELRKDVENVRIINETIPRSCFKEIELEATNPPRRIVL